MEALRPLRERAELTRLLILAGIHARPATLSDIADGLGVTVQAVSAHAKTLASRGQLRSDADGYHVTPAGVERLHEGTRALRDAVIALGRPLDVVHVTSAVAGIRIKARQEVGLSMVDGELVAGPATGPSRGKAKHAAAPGEEVVVDSLQGIVQFEPGTLSILSVPGPEEGGIRKVDRAALRRLTARLAHDRVGAHGTGAAILARSLGPVDFSFAADRAAFNAAERGLDVLLWTSRERLPELVATVHRLNQTTLRRIPIAHVEAPERQ